MVVATEQRSSLDLARELSSEISARAREGEMLRTMPGDLVEKIRLAGLFNLGLPRVLGGLELPPLEALEVIEEMSRADGSAGWTLLIGNNSAFLAWLEPSVARELIGDDPRFPSTAMYPTGVAVPETSSSLVLDGRWQFSSGCMHSRLFQCGTFVHADGQIRMWNGHPDIRLVVVPPDVVEIHDTWDVAGLQGTGSHEVTVAGAHVPVEHTSCPYLEPAPHDGPLWRIPFFTFAGMYLAGFPLGVARRALDEFIEFAQTKTRIMLSETLASDSAVQVETARAEGMLASARALIVDAIGSIWDTALLGDIPSLDQRAQFVLAMQHAIFASTWTVDTVYRLAGASAVYGSHPLQRCFRDIHTGSQHHFFSAEGLNRIARLRFNIDQPTFMI